MSFEAVQKKIAASQNIPMGNAGAILAAQTRRASPAARKKNPALNKVKGTNKSDMRAAAMRALQKRRAAKNDNDGDE